MREDYSLIEDDKLVRRIAATNDTFLFGILYDRYSKVVYNKCLSFVRDKQEAEDLTHDIFVKLFISLRKFSGRSKFSTWLYSFTYNYCVNYVQRKKNKYAPAFNAEQYAELSDYDDSELLQAKENRLMKALEQIPPEDKMILLMKFQDDMSIKDLQDLLDIGESAVKMRIKRAKARVIQAFNQL